MSIATVQQQLAPMKHGEEILVSAYLRSLCTSLSRSMIGNRKPITVQVRSTKGTVTSDTAVSLGLITTELVINALKHAFPHGQTGKVFVEYKAKSRSWSLTISDNGVGAGKTLGTKRAGLGTSIIGALSNQLNAVIRRESSAKGTSVSIIHHHA